MAKIAWRHDLILLPLATAGLVVYCQRHLSLHVSVAADVDIWAMNLCPGDHDDGATILYHFNPRRRRRGGRLVENDKNEDDWGRAVKSPLPPKPALFGLEKAEVALRVVRRAGHVDVHVTINRQQATAWRLRGEVSQGALALLVPTRDDFGNRQGVVVHDACPCCRRTGRTASAGRPTNLCFSVPRAFRRRAGKSGAYFPPSRT